jgi:hypothetical protein
LDRGRRHAAAGAPRPTPCPALDAGPPALRRLTLAPSRRSDRVRPAWDARALQEGDRRGGGRGNTAPSTIVWFRLDLRLADNPALNAAVASGGPEFARFPWKRQAAWRRAWQRGETGYPLVDAGMRELGATGWMHNRVRMVAASFLVKHLLQPWREGARWFWDTLVDADLANNALGWQWSAGCGGAHADAGGPCDDAWTPVLDRTRHADEHWHALPAGEVARVLATDAARGLESPAIVERRRQSGANVLSSRSPTCRP